ncbi:type VII secretion protein EccE [uncultured Jatrophihabitans sp.]|uniref:type VII secretion protein EccE n=1 Tax=uncultured Jatrophihabitans sp. TaxID=1610747 RepID=UPI0035CB238D
MPRFAFAQLALLELAAAAALGGLAYGGVGRIVGPAVGTVVLLAAIVPVQRRWLYQAGASWLGLIRRRRRLGRRAGLEALFGEHTVVTVPGGSSGGDLAAVRAGTTWCLPLVLGLDGVFNDDPPVPIRLLAELMQVEDVPLSSVRLFTLTTPAQVPPQAPAGPERALCPIAARYCLITLDTRRASEAIAARGGGENAVNQILRRCAVQAEQTLSTAGVTVHRLQEPAVRNLFATWLGPAGVSGGRRSDRAGESWGDVRVAGTRSVSFAIGGTGADVPERVARLAAAAPTAVVGSALLLRRRSGRDRIQVTTGARRVQVADLETAIIVRFSVPDSAADADAGQAMMLLARAYDLVVQRSGGEQGALLQATVPVGMGEAA